MPDEIDLEQFEEKVRERYSIPQGLWRSISEQESGGNVNAISPTNVRGKWQVTRKTAAQYGLDTSDPFHQAAAAAKYLREGYDKYADLKDDNERWLAAAGHYYGGPDAVKSDGTLSTSSRDNLSTPSDYVTSIAQRWKAYNDSQPTATTPQPSSAVVPKPTQSSGGMAATIAALHPKSGRPPTAKERKLAADETARQKATPQIARMVEDFEALKREGSVDAARSVAQKIKAQYGRWMEVGEGDGWPYVKSKVQGWNPIQPTGAISTPSLEDQQARFAQRPILDQLSERGLDALARGGGQVSRMLRQTAGAGLGLAQGLAGGDFRPVDLPDWRQAEEERFKVLEERRLRRPSSFVSDVAEGTIEALPAAAAAIGGTVLTGGGLPAAAAMGAGMGAAGADWRDPKRAATQTVLGATAPIVGGQVGSKIGGAIAKRLAGPASQAVARAGGELVGGGLGNVIGSGAEQLGFEGRVDPRELAKQGIIGAALNVPGAAGAARRPATMPLSGLNRATVEPNIVAPTQRAQFRRPTNPVDQVIADFGNRLAEIDQMVPLAERPAAIEAARRDFNARRRQAALIPQKPAAEPLATPAENIPENIPRTVAKPAENIPTAPQLPEGVRIVREGEPVPPVQRGQRQIPMEFENPDGTAETVRVIVDGRVDEATLRPMIEQALRTQEQPAAQPSSVAQPEAASPKPPPVQPVAPRRQPAPIQFTQLGPEGLRGGIPLRKSSLPSQKLLGPGRPEDVPTERLATRPQPERVPTEPLTEEIPTQRDAPPTRPFEYADAPETQKMPALSKYTVEDAPTRELPAVMGQRRTADLPVAPLARRTGTLPRQEQAQIPIRRTAESPQPEPTNRIVEGAGDELPRRPLRPREGQPVGTFTPRRMPPPMQRPAGRPQARLQGRMYPEFPADRRAMIGQGRRVATEIEAGRGDKGEFGKIAQGMFKSASGQRLHGQDSFFHDPAVKGALGLSRDAEMAQVRVELKKDMARMLGVNTDEVSLTQINPETWNRWARQKQLPADAVGKMKAAIGRYQEGVLNDIEKTAKAMPEQPSERTTAMSETATRDDMDRTTEGVGKVAETGRKIQHTRLGEVVEAEDQSGVAKGKLRVIRADGTTHIIQNPRTRGNREAAFVKKEETPRTETPRKYKTEDIPQAAPKDLDETSRGIETRFRDYLANNFDEAVKRYRDKFGKEINTDNARELSEDYARSDEARSLYSPAVHEPSSWFAKELYKMMLAEKPEKGQQPMVLFTAGGTGAGKTSTLATSEKMATAVVDSQMIMDGNLNNAKKAIQKIDQALAAGKSVKIAAVYRDPIESWRKGVLPRAEKRGRAVPVQIHVETHSQMRDALEGIALHYADDPRVEIGFIDNTRGKDKARDAINVDLFRKIGDTKALRNQLVKETEQAYEKGEISQRVFAGSLGSGRGGAAEENIAGPRVRERDGRSAKLQPSERSERRPADTARAAEDLGRGVSEQASTGRRARGDESTLTIPRGGDRPIRYEVRELADVQPSHDPHTFQKNPKYPYVNDRDYTSPANRTDVEENTKAGKFKPPMVLNDDPTAAGGPPIIRDNGAVLGGNSRTMMIARVYKNHPAEAQKYRDLLKKKAGGFGINAAELDNFKQPVLVRVDEGAGATQKLITDLNIMPGKAMSSTEAASARSKSMPAETMQFLADRLGAEGPEGTLAQALEGGKGIRILNRLIEDNIIPKGERARYLSDQGNLSPAAKTEIEQMLLGRLFRDQDQMKSTSPEMRNKLVRVAPQLGKMAGTEWDVSDMIPNAIEAVAASKAEKLKLSELNRRQVFAGMETQYSPEELAIADVLQRNGPAQIERVFRRYVTEFDQAQQGQGLFGDPLSQKDAFADVFQPQGSKSGSLFGESRESKGHIMGFGLGGLQGMFKGRKAPKANPTKADIESASIGKSIGNIFRTGSQAIRTVKTAFDLSAPFGQGAFLTIPHPLKAAKAFDKMLRSVNQTQSDAIDMEIAFHPLRKLMEKSDLHVATLEKIKGRAGEEAFMLQALNKVPGIGASERTYRTYLDVLRISVFEGYVKSLQNDGYTFENNPKAFKDAAAAINIASGRGSIKKGGKIEKAMDLAGDILFAPRNLISKFQMLDPVRYASLAPGARKLVWRDAMVNLGVILGTGALLRANGFSVSFNAESDEFLTARLGNTRYDLTFGAKTQVQFLARMAMGAYRKSTGEGNLPGKDPLSIAKNFARNKLAPGPGLAIDAFKGADFKGEKFADKSKTQIALETVAPMIVEGFYEGYKDEGLKGAAKVVGPSFLGARVNTYPDRAKVAFLDVPPEVRAEQKAAGKTRPFLTPKKAQSRDEKDETPSQFEDRKALANEWNAKYGRQLVGSEIYRESSKEEKAAALDYLKEQINKQTGQKRPSLWLLAPGHIFETVRESERKKRVKAAQDTDGT